MVDERSLGPLRACRATVCMQHVLECGFPMGFLVCGIIEFLADGTRVSYFYFLCVRVFCLHVYLCPRYRREPEDSIRVSGTGVTDGCKLPGKRWNLNPNLQPEQQTLLNMESVTCPAPERGKKKHSNKRHATQEIGVHHLSKTQ